MHGLNRYTLCDDTKVTETFSMRFSVHGDARIITKKIKWIKCHVPVLCTTQGSPWSNLKMTFECRKLELALKLVSSNISTSSISLSSEILEGKNSISYKQASLFGNIRWIWRYGSHLKHHKVKTCKRNCTLNFLYDILTRLCKSGGTIYICLPYL